MSACAWEVLEGAGRNKRGKERLEGPGTGLID
jgi:hypothetical protein